jgi:hypothetical protein
MRTGIPVVYPDPKPADQKRPVVIASALCARQQGESPLPMAHPTGLVQEGTRATLARYPSPYPIQWVDVANLILICAAGSNPSSLKNRQHSHGPYVLYCTYATVPFRRPNLYDTRSDNILRCCNHSLKPYRGINTIYRQKADDKECP